eukprot:2867907-Prymnesium_polylepis.1
MSGSMATTADEVTAATRAGRPRTNRMSERGCSCAGRNRARAWQQRRGVGFALRPTERLAAAVHSARIQRMKAARALDELRRPMASDVQRVGPLDEGDARRGSVLLLVPARHQRIDRLDALDERAVRCARLVLQAHRFADLENVGEDVIEVERVERNHIRPRSHRRCDPLDRLQVDGAHRANVLRQDLPRAQVCILSLRALTRVGA